MRDSDLHIPEQAWFKSSYSGANTTECVEAAVLPDGVAIRDSKDTEGPVLAFSPEAWRTFIGSVRDGSLR
jgi:hypothetical protein